MKKNQIANRQIVYITYNISQDAIQPKYRLLTPNIIETVPFYSYRYPFTHTHSTSYISINENSQMKMELMLKIKNFSFRSQTNGLYPL